ncbi:MAG: ABC-2 transporter permease [Propionibacteriaceae bacterium]|nr:ABC-2 transporter permease [Propionibacteriaceae bacterium]
MSDHALTPLIRLDLRSLFVTGRMWLVFLAVVSAVSLIAGAEMALPMAAAGGLLTATTVFATDETYRLRLLYGALPIRRRTVIVGHYLTLGLVTVGMVAVGFGVGATAAIVRGTSVADVAIGAAPALAVLLFMTALMVPVYVRFGTRAASIILVSALMGVFGIGMAIGDLPGVEPIAAQVLAVLSAADWWALAALPIAGAALLAVSCVISIGIYQRQDH